MIFDGYWKKELRGYIKQIRMWQFLSAKFDKYAEHQINKYILYSAIVIRKLIEEEKDTEKESKSHDLRMPVFHLLSYKVPVLKLKFTGDENFILHKFIHSYKWALAYSFENRKPKISSFIVVSDRYKAKYIYCISLDDWITYIEYCIEKSVV